MSEVKHTPLPWGHSGSMVKAPPPLECIRRIKANEVPFTAKRICLCDNETYMTQDEQEANAEFIVRACNNHYALLAACELALERFQKDGWPLNSDNVKACGMLEAAIANAKESA